MRITFWGTRGSLPAPLSAHDVRAKVLTALQLARSHHFADEQAVEAFIEHDLPFDVKGTFGGNTSCVQLDAGGSEYVVCDAGSGLRVFGNAMLEKHGYGAPQTYHIFMSHLHWDHIMGFPFFASTAAIRMFARRSNASSEPRPFRYLSLCSARHSNSSTSIPARRPRSPV
jgi:phosphoribosyl 1,2-cyclic phosphodiesterase